jgi:hypothetical protein
MVQSHLGHAGVSSSRLVIDNEDTLGFITKHADCFPKSGVAIMITDPYAYDLNYVTEDET